MGPEGLVWGLGTVTYNHFAGQEFESIVEEIVLAALQALNASSSEKWNPIGVA